ncbi:MAG: DUF1292 domain-containing protein [Ruminococcus flavefaciens]|nr:DUF1292 domain-containing protein [Ruminococcus flavefaciens]
MNSFIRNEEIKGEYKKYLYLEDEDGNKVRFEILDVVKYDERSFIIVQFIEDDDDDKELLQVVFDEFKKQ